MIPAPSTTTDASWSGPITGARAGTAKGLRTASYGASRGWSSSTPSTVNNAAAPIIAQPMARQRGVRNRPVGVR